MTYPYGMYNAPTVGNGLGGLPTRTDVGQVQSFSSSPSSDFLLCNGATVAIADYPVLYSKVAGSILGLNNSPTTQGNSTDLPVGFATDGYNTIFIGFNGSTTSRKSVNGGVTFANATTLSSARFVYMGNGNWLAVTKTSMEYSSNATSWASSTGVSSVGTSGERSVGSDLNGNALLFSGNATTLQVLKSTNYGQSWSAAGYSLATARTGGGSAYAGNGVWVLATNGGTTSTTIYRSTDFGATLSAVTVSFTDVYSIDSDMNGTVMVIAGVSPSIVYRSTDYGLTWETTGVITSSNDYAIRTNRNGTWIVPGPNTSEYFLISTNSGTTWFPWTPSADVESSSYAAFIDNGIGAVKNTQAAFYRTYASDGVSFTLPSIAPQSLDGPFYYIKAR